MFVAYVFEPPSSDHLFGTSYVLAAKVEGRMVTISSFWFGRKKEGVLELSEEGLLKEIKGECEPICRIIRNIENKKFPFVTLSTDKTYQQLIDWRKAYDKNRTYPSKCLQQMFWECSTKKQYVFGNNCTDDALRVLRDGCGIFPKTTTLTKIIQSFCVTTLCLSTCACSGICVCLPIAVTAPTFPIVVNTPTQVFYALQNWANQHPKHGSVNFLDYIKGKTATVTETLKANKSKEEKVEGPLPQEMTDVMKGASIAVRF